MKLLFVADGRSPIALNWMRYFSAEGHEVHLASTYACADVPGLASLEVVPVALSEVNAAGARGRGRLGGLLRALVPLSLRTAIRQSLGPLTLRRAGEQLAEIIQRLQPDLVHAMRIPYEGMAAALAMEALPGRKPPLLISTWGNDFTLHAPSTRQMRQATRRAMYAADALHADCQRDVRLAQEWGFDAQKPVVVLPGGGGIRLGTFYPDEAGTSAPVVINPRGMRAYVRNDTFFQAAARVLQAQPEVRFLCPNMAGETEALRWVSELKLGQAVSLLPRQTQAQMAALYRQSQVALSITMHDGTPNTLLEALACGCFPIAGDIESLREWITPGVSGLLVDPGSPQELADAILQALAQPELRQAARQHNLLLVRQRAEYGAVMAQAEVFYRRCLKES